MPEANQGANQIIAFALLASVIVLAAVAGLILAGTIPVAEGTRPMVAIALGIAAFTDLIIAIWFFRKGQSS